MTEWFVELNRRPYRWNIDRALACNLFASFSKPHTLLAQSCWNQRVAGYGHRRIGPWRNIDVLVGH